MRFLKAGTVQRLVESLANDDGELESTYINVFLATYRAFTTPREVLELLLTRYDALDEGSGALAGEQHRKTLVQALHVWLDAYPGDWKSPPNHPLLGRLLDFTHRRLPASELELKARHRLHRFQREDQLGKGNFQQYLCRLENVLIYSLINCRHSARFKYDYLLERLRLILK